MTPEELEKLADLIAERGELKHCRFNVIEKEFGLARRSQDGLIERGEWLEGIHFVKRKGSNSRFFIKKAINEWVEGQ